MNGIRPKIVVILIGRLLLPVFLLCIAGCGEDHLVVTAEKDLSEGPWVAWSPYKWDHDGYTYEGLYCKVYSDGVSRRSRADLVEYADSLFIEIMDSFDFNDYDDFLFPPGYDRIAVYLNLYNEPAIAAAFWGSVLITVQSIEPVKSRLTYLLKHELTHAFEYLIEGNPELGADVWFREGIAIYSGSDGGMNYVSNVDSLVSWIRRNAEYENFGNPISISEWGDYPEGSDITGYYTMFDCVMRYILDSEGMGRTMQDILDLFYDIRNGTSFDEAFQVHFGISVEDLEVQIYFRLSEYLPEG